MTNVRFHHSDPDKPEDPSLACGALDLSVIGRGGEETSLRLLFLVSCGILETVFKLAPLPGALESLH